MAQARFQEVPPAAVMAESAELRRPPGLGVWVLAARPRTLSAAVTPVVVGTAVAASQGSFPPLPALAALFSAISIQIGTNLANDYHDFERGADTAERVGPRRVTQSGLVAPRTVRNAAIGTFAIAFVLGVYLTLAGGWPILFVGLASIAAGWLYTGGPWPVGYHGLGDVFVFVFFGLVAGGGGGDRGAAPVPPPGRVLPGPGGGAAPPHPA